MLRQVSFISIDPKIWVSVYQYSCFLQLPRDVVKTVFIVVTNRFVNLVVLDQPEAT